MELKSMKKRKTDFNINYLTMIKEMSIKNSIKEEDQKKRENKDEFGLGCNLFLKKTFCRKTLNPMEREKVEAYEFALEYVKNKLDVKTYMKYLDTIDKLKIFNYNDVQNLCFKNLKKPNLLNKDEKDLFELEILDDDPEAGTELENQNIEEKLKIVKYFIKKLREDSIEETDMKLFDFLDPKLKLMVLNESYDDK